MDTSLYFQKKNLSMAVLAAQLCGLKSNKIFTSIHYATPLTSMSYYQKKYKINSKKYKNSNNYSKNNISLPNYPKLSILEVEFICSKLKELSNK